MLSFYAGTGAADVAAGDGPLPPEILWVDLVRPEPSEKARVERATGLPLPSFEALSEIETSSRLRIDNGILYLSASLVQNADGDAPASTPVGFVLTPQRLVTVRFEPLVSFATFARELGEPSRGCATAPEMFAGLLDAIVDRIADVLEGIAGELDMLSHRAFRAGPISSHPNRHRLHEDADLRRLLRRLGRSGDLASKMRDSLLGLGRIVPYVATHGSDWLSAALKARLETARQDVVSLADYDAHLLNKVQFLLDATLGLINIEQNNIIKVLTIVSVVGVPPTLIAGVYGMNFKNMPEYDWSWGYPYGLALIALSAILPLVWFKWRGWF